MYCKKTLVLGMAIVLLLGIHQAFAQTAEEILSRGIQLEEVKGELEQAIEVYQKIVKDFPENRPVAAKALFHIGLCNEKLGNREAKKAYKEVIQSYEEQKEIVAKARERLSKLNLMTDKIAKLSLTPKYTKIKIPSELSWNAVSSIDGQQLLLVYDKKLWIMPLSGNLGSDIPGIPIQLNTEGIKVTWAGLAWSENGKIIAFNEINDIALQDKPEKDKTNQNIYILSVEGGKPEKIVENYCGPRAVSFRISISPNGKTLAYSSVQDNELYIFSIPVAGGIPKKLVKTPAREPVFSPDGKMIAYVEDKRLGRKGGGLWMVPASGGSPNLVIEAGNASSPVWSPDASKIAFLDYSEGNKIYIIPISRDRKPAGEKITIDAPEGTKSVRFLTGWGKNNKIGTIINRVQYALYTIPEQGGQATMVYHGSAAQPRWSPDEKHILFRKAVNQQEEDRSDYKIAVISADGGKDTNILSELDNKIRLMPYGTGIRVSPNGEKIVISTKIIDDDTVYIDRYPVTQIWTITISGRKLTKLTIPPVSYSDDCPCWSPDGKSIAFIRTKLKEDRGDPYGEMGIYVVDSSGGEPKLLLLEPENFIYSINWSPDGKRFVFVGYQGGVPELWFLEDFLLEEKSSF